MDEVVARRDWRDGPIYWIICTAIIVAILLLVSVSYWASRSAPNDITQVTIIDTLPFRFGCEPEHRLGLYVTFTRNGAPKETQALACFDFSKLKWHMQFSGPR
jgi:hypothetical protein